MNYVQGQYRMRGTKNSSHLHTIAQRDLNRKKKMVIVLSQLGENPTRASISQREFVTTETDILARVSSNGFMVGAGSSPKGSVVDTT
jgi:hypothetical protein